MHSAEVKDAITEQLKDTCKLADARWAVWLTWHDNDWHIGLRHNLSQARLNVLNTLVRQTKTKTWLSGTLASGRTRSRQNGPLAKKLACERLYMFPNAAHTSALLVGADHLEKKAEGFFRVLALVAPQLNEWIDLRPDSLQELAPRSALPIRPYETGFEAPFDLEEVLTNVLEFMVGVVACEAALMSIRSGDIFHVEAVWNSPPEIRGSDISLRENEMLSKIATTRQGVIVRQVSTALTDRAHLGLGLKLDHPIQEVLGIPIVIGQRVIGHMAFASTRSHAFSAADLQRVNEQASRLAYVVENAIIFGEAARYLQQLALLNELASAASLGVDANEVATRVMHRLRRTFGSTKTGVYLLSPDGKMLREYGAASSDGQAYNLPLENDLAGNVVRKGLPLRVGDPAEAGDIDSGKTGGMVSGLAVPLKYRGAVIGALALESVMPNAYSQQDEQLLIVIASHLAGLFENMRLNEETRQRAHNMNMIHQVVRRVVGLTDLNEIAQVTAELMVKGFPYEKTVVLLVDGNGKTLLVQGASKGSAELSPSVEGDGRVSSIIPEVLHDGVSRQTNDLSQAANNENRWDSEMCVALREGERILGVVDVVRSQRNAFSENDMLALEALAGVLSSVVLSARRYQQLQDSVRQLQAARETAIDIAGDLDLDALLKRVVHRARELIGAKGAELGLVDEEKQEVRILVSETPWFSYPGDRVPLMAGVAGRVAAFGEPLVVSDYNAWSGRLYPEREAPFRTVAGVPLKFQGKVIGTLTVIDDRAEREFGPADMQLLELLAPQVAVWIRNARLYQELQERIEAQRLAENRLIRSARLAAVGEMAAGVAHEMNNPLTTVTGFVELVLDELPADSPHREELELVLKEAQRARTVIRRMLDFSRPVENQRTGSDINELVTDVLMLVYHLARTGRVDILLDLWQQDPPLPWILVDPSQIKQVLLNLIHNGIQAMPQGGQLTIKTGLWRDENQQWITISIRDSGEGIPADVIDRIFEPFFTTRPAGAGTGLGLSVSYGIVNDHGGYIEVESIPGSGSCFNVFLPIESDGLNE